MPDDRSKDRHSFRASLVVGKEEWKAFGDLVGDEKRSEVVRQFIDSMLGRPGIRMPRRRDHEKKTPPAEADGV